MLHNQSLVERCLTKRSSYEDFQTWLTAMEDWVQARADVDLDKLGPRTLQTMVRATIDAALLRELNWHGAMVGRVSWARLVYTIREVLKIAPHNLKISLRQCKQGNQGMRKFALDLEELTDLACMHPDDAKSVLLSALN